MAFETSWHQYSASFSSDGTSSGIVTVASTAGLHTKQQVLISATGQPGLSLEVKEVLSTTTLRVGPIGGLTASGQSTGGAGFTGTDLSAYTVVSSAAIFARQQEKIDGGSNSVIKDVYEAAPVVALRTMAVDTVGNYVAPNAVSITVSNVTVTTNIVGTNSVFQYARVAASSITSANSSQTTGVAFVTLARDTKIIQIFNSLNQDISLSFGGTETYRLEPGESFSVDAFTNSLLWANGTVITVFQNGTPPTTGSIRFVGQG